MNRNYFVFALLLVYLNGFSQEKSEIQIKYANTITSNELKIHLSILASDSLEGRETGEKGLELAADYIGAQFKSLGIPTLNGADYFQNYQLENRKFEGVSIYRKDEDVISNPRYRIFRDFYFTETFENQTLSTEKIGFVGYGIEDDKYSDYKGMDVSGKIIMMYGGEPYSKKEKKYSLSGTNEESEWSQDLEMKLDLAKEKGANAVFVVIEKMKKRIKWNSNYYRNEVRMNIKDGVQFKNNIPYFYVSEKMSNALMQTKVKNKIKQIDKKFLPQSFTVERKIKITNDGQAIELNSKNVYAFIEGSDLKEEVLAITAHFDHVGMENDSVVNNGADDNASGTSALLEIAQAFTQAKKEGHGPRRSVMIMLVSAEEKGLLGSEYYSENPIVPLEQTVANLNIDMIGRTDEKHEGNANYIYLIGSDRLSTELHEISETANATYSNIEFDYSYNAEDDPEQLYYRSDHYNFAKHNIPAIFYYDGGHMDYHKPTDTVEKIDFDKMESITRMVFHTAWEIANRDKRPALKQD